ncbi:class I SAM-dependent methyltransferase [Chitinimonas viridis]|uniref:Class I SAM-dependent methyltransferase n=1 Tax=Chitinimonas viridis TaxID=664880 RepID=A0ABT8B8D9_9NEIS|nr:class I SAM-dependent methyltransferase [Chitinimonas viridis]MDN3578499.1 class I SAM-dependent methyltransferase [Chitinimonas viridis]
MFDPLQTTLPALSAELLAAALGAAAGQAVPLYQPRMWIPQFPDYQQDAWSVRQVPMLTMKGYWGSPYLVANTTMLMRHGRESWMSVTPSELESQELGCRLAQGHTVVLGFGMGIAACNAALNPAVSKVTVVEYDPIVLDLAETAGIIAQLPVDIAAKVTLLQGDAHHWQPGEAVDTLLADYWFPFYDPERLAEMRAVQARVAAKQVFFWGQELNLAWLIHQRHGEVCALDDTALAELIATDAGLPLLWPRGEDYGTAISTAARHWLPLAVRQGMRWPMPA